MSDSAIVLFYSDARGDSVGRTLSQLQALDDWQMDYFHDFIQWLFPNARASAYNPGAPVLTDADVRTFHDRPELRAAVRVSYLRFLRFLGLEESEGGEVCPIAGRGPRPRVFAIPNHNWLRITRVLLCLNALGLPDECRSFYRYLEGVHARGEGVSDATFGYWREAAGGA